MSGYPSGDYQDYPPNRPAKPAFSVCEPFQGTLTVMLNKPMVQLLIKFIDDIDDEVEVEIRAFMNALNAPHASRELWAQKRRRYRDQS